MRKRRSKARKVKLEKDTLRARKRRLTRLLRRQLQELDYVDAYDDEEGDDLDALYGPWVWVESA